MSGAKKPAGGSSDWLWVLAQVEVGSLSLVPRPSTKHSRSGLRKHCGTCHFKKYPPLLDIPAFKKWALTPLLRMDLVTHNNEQIKVEMTMWHFWVASA